MDSERRGERRVDGDEERGAPTSDAPVAVELDGVRKRYGETTAVDGVDLAVREGEFFTLVGPSGCGKTTLLRLVAGFESPTAGTVRFDDADVSGVPPENRDVGVVFQNYALFPHMTVGENVAYGLNFTDPPGGISREERVRELLELVDLAGTADRDPDSLSGGQRQRVAMARALAPGPDVLLLDEPMSALDAQLRERLRVQIKAIQRELAITTVYVTHDQEEALAVSDRVAVMRAGATEQVAPPRTVYCRPATRFVAEFVGDNNVFDGTVTEITEPNRQPTAGEKRRGPSGTPGRIGSSGSTADRVSGGGDASDGERASSGGDASDGDPPSVESHVSTGTDRTIERDKTRPGGESPQETKGVNDRAAKPRIAVVDLDGDHLRIGVGDEPNGSEGVGVGDRVTFCVRPEALRVGVDDGPNVLRAAVESAEFLGETTRVHLDWGGRELLVRTREPVTGEVAVGFDPWDAHVVDTSE